MTALARSWRGRGARIRTRLDQSIAGRRSIIRSEVHCGLADPSLTVRRLNGQHSLFFGLGFYWLTGASDSPTCPLIRARVSLGNPRVYNRLGVNVRTLPLTTTLIDLQVYLT